MEKTVGAFVKSAWEGDKTWCQLVLVRIPGDQVCFWVHWFIDPIPTSFFRTECVYGCVYVQKVAATKCTLVFLVMRFGIERKMDLHTRFLYWILFFNVWFLLSQNWFDVIFESSQRCIFQTYFLRSIVWQREEGGWKLWNLFDVKAVLVFLRRCIFFVCQDCLAVCALSVCGLLAFLQLTPAFLIPQVSTFTNIKTNSFLISKKHYYVLNLILGFIVLYLQLYNVLWHLMLIVAKHSMQGAAFLVEYFFDTRTELESVGVNESWSMVAEGTDWKAPFIFCPQVHWVITQPKDWGHVSATKPKRLQCWNNVGWSSACSFLNNWTLQSLLTFQWWVTEAKIFSSNTCERTNPMGKNYLADLLADLRLFRCKV